MTELEKLKKQRAEINARIKELENQDVVCGVAALHYENTVRSEWQVRVRVNRSVEWKDNSRWTTVVRAKGREEVIQMMPGVIGDLVGLYDQLKE